MKKTHTIRMCIVTAALSVAQCSMVGPEQPVVTGSVAPHVVFASSKDADISFDPLITTHIQNVKLQVIHDGDIHEETFDFSLGSGRIEGIEPGEVTVKVMAQDPNEVTIMSGSVNVQVKAGKTARPTIAAAPDRENAPYLSPAAVGGDNSVRLEWYMWEVDGSPRNYEHFHIQTSDNGTSNWTDIQSVNYSEHSWIDHGPSAGLTCYYRVIAGGPDGPSEPSNSISVIIPGASTGSRDAPFLNKPTVDVSGVHLTWTIDAGALANTDWFRVERYRPAMDKWDFIGDNIPTDVRDFTDANPVRNATRKYRVCAIQSGSAPVCSNEEHVSVQ